MPAIPMAQMYFESIWKWTLKFELRKKANLFGNAVLHTSHQQCRAQRHRQLCYGLPLTKLGNIFSAFLAQINILTCHFYIREMHQQSEDNLKTLPLLWKYLFRVWKNVHGTEWRVGGGVSSGATWEAISVNETLSPPPGEQTSAEIHQEAPPQRTSR